MKTGGFSRRLDGSRGVPGRHPDEQGMSMAEMLIVVLIISAVTVVALPQLLQIREDYRLDAVAREISEHLGNARIMAVVASSDHRVRVANETTYIVEEETSPGTWSPRETHTLPAGFTITTGAVVEFHYGGSATQGPIVPAITNPNNNTRSVVTTTSGTSFVQ